MRYSTTIVLAALSVGQTMAGPTHAHLHRHRDVHVKKDAAPVDWDALDWDDMGINWSSAWAAGQTHSTTAPAAVPTTASPSVGVPATVTSSPPVVSSSASSAPVASSSSVSSSISSDIASLFEGVEGLANKFTSFGEPAIGSGSEVAATGNIGGPQGSNMLLVDSAEGYPLTNTFINTSGSNMTIWCWNKAFSRTGNVADAEANLGSCLASSTPALSIALAPGAKQVVAFQDQTLMAWSQATHAKTPSGAPAITWGEASFKLAGSGFDVSAILNPDGNTYKMSISAVETPCISSETQNYWYAANGNADDPQPEGTSDGSCYIPAGSVTLTTEMGGFQ